MNEKEELAFHTWRNDLAAETRMQSLATTYAWTGEFREDGVLVPTRSPGFAAIPTYELGGAAGDFEEGFVVQLLLYAPMPLNRYVVVEMVWAQEPEPPVAYPVGKPHPEGTAPLRWTEEVRRRGGEGELPDGPLVVWNAPEATCPLRCRIYPEIDTPLVASRGC